MTKLQRSLHRAVELLGGPHRATRLYEDRYVGKADDRGVIVHKLARSTLDTWLAGTVTERMAIVAERMAALAADETNHAPKPPRKPPHGKTKGKRKGKPARAKRKAPKAPTPSAHAA